MTTSTPCRVLALALLIATPLHDARADPPQAGEGDPLVVSVGVRARFGDGKLRPATLIISDQAVTVEQDPHQPLRFEYDDLHIRRGRHYQGGPLLDKQVIFDTLTYNLPWVALDGLEGLLYHVAIPIAVTPGVVLMFRMLNRNKGYWLELHTHQPNQSVYLRLPRNKRRRQAIFDEFERRDPKQLMVRPPSPVPKPQWIHPVAEGDLALDFTLEDMDGSPWRLSALRGKVVLLNFWATWCGPCRREMPHLENLHRRFSPDGLIVLGINDEPRAQAREFLSKRGMTFPNLHTPDGQVFRQYGITALPTSLIIDRNGRVHKRIEGFPGERGFARALREPLFGRKLSAK